VSSKIKCPKCGQSEHVSLLSPDYGHGQGVVFACFDPVCGRYSFRDDSPEAQAESRASLELSKRNADKLRQAAERAKGKR